MSENETNGETTEENGGGTATESKDSSSNGASSNGDTNVGRVDQVLGPADRRAAGSGLEVSHD